jgi:hypothetical protein
VYIAESELRCCRIPPSLRSSPRPVGSPRKWSTNASTSSGLIRVISVPGPKKPAARARYSSTVLSHASPREAFLNSLSSSVWCQAAHGAMAVCASRSRLRRGFEDCNAAAEGGLGVLAASITRRSAIRSAASSRARNCSANTESSVPLVSPGAHNALRVPPHDRRSQCARLVPVESGIQRTEGALRGRAMVLGSGSGDLQATRGGCFGKQVFCQLNRGVTQPTEHKLSVILLSTYSGPGATRTRDLLLRRQALYPTELRTRQTGCESRRILTPSPLDGTPRGLHPPQRLGRALAAPVPAREPDRVAIQA